MSASFDAFTVLTPATDRGIMVRGGSALWLTDQSGPQAYDMLRAIRFTPGVEEVYVAAKLMGDPAELNWGRMYLIQINGGHAVVRDLLLVKSLPEAQPDLATNHHDLDGAALASYVTDLAEYVAPGQRAIDLALDYATRAELIQWGGVRTGLLEWTTSVEEAGAGSVLPAGFRRQVEALPTEDQIPTLGPDGRVDFSEHRRLLKLAIWANLR